MSITRANFNGIRSLNSVHIYCDVLLRPLYNKTSPYFRPPIMGLEQPMLPCLGLAVKSLSTVTLKFQRTDMMTSQ